MAFDPHKEDYQRLALRYAQTLTDQGPHTATRAFLAFGRRFSQERDGLPQTDADRAFHLVIEATTLIDYQLPFASDEEAETIIARGHRLLDEAIALDPECHDAVRMKMSAECQTFESYYDFLKTEAPAVKASCERRLADSQLEEDSDQASLETYLALCPYLRWLSTLASKAVICGRNREALRIIDELLLLDPLDTADARFTAAIALAKLEDDQGLDQLMHRREIRRLHDADNAWIRLAYASLAYRRLAYREAREHIASLVKAYPYATPTLALQRELPDGVYARLAVTPLSEDELVVATSEATVLFQEGRDAFGKGAFGSWVMLEAIGLATKEELADISDLVEYVARTLPEASRSLAGGGRDSDLFGGDAGRTGRTGDGAPGAAQDNGRVGESPSDGGQAWDGGRSGDVGPNGGQSGGIGPDAAQGNGRFGVGPSDGGQAWDGGPDGGRSGDGISNSPESDGSAMGKRGMRKGGSPSGTEPEDGRLKPDDGSPEPDDGHPGFGDGRPGSDGGRPGPDNTQPQSPDSGGGTR